MNTKTREAACSQKWQAAFLRSIPIPSIPIPSIPKNRKEHLTHGKDQDRENHEH